MNIKMTTNSKLSVTASKKQKQTKQTTRPGTKSQIWRLFGGLSAGRGREEMGEKVHGLRRIIVRYKIDREMLRIV